MSHLRYRTTENFDFVGHDKGDGRTGALSVYRPIPAEGYYSLGDYAMASLGPVAGEVLTVSLVDKESDSEGSFLAKPVDFKPYKAFMPKTLIFWVPVPPPGYVAIGHVATSDDGGKPDVPDYRCLREDLVEPNILTKAMLRVPIYSSDEAHVGQGVLLYQLPITGVVLASQPHHHQKSGHLILGEPRQPKF